MKSKMPKEQYWTDEPPHPTKYTKEEWWECPMPIKLAELFYMREAFEDPELIIVLDLEITYYTYVLTQIGELTGDDNPFELEVAA